MIFIIIEILAILYINLLILPQLSMLTLGYPIQVCLGFETRVIVHPKAKFSDDILYISFSESGLHIYHSYDNGYSWIKSGKTSSIIDQNILSYDLDVIGGTNLSLIYTRSNESSLYFTYSDDKGESWRKSIKIASNTVGQSISFINSTSLITAFYNRSSNCTVILKSSDLGNNWNFLYNFTFQLFPHQLYTAHNKTIFLVAKISGVNGGNLKLFSSDDLGKTWDEKYFNLPSGGYRQIAMDSNSNLYYCYSEAQRIKILKSTDFGISWSPEIFLELEKDLPHTPRDIMMDISSDNKILIGYSIECPRIFPLNPCDILNYFFIGKDIWSFRYISWFFGYFLIFTAILSAIEIIIYILLIKWKKGKIKQ